MAVRIVAEGDGVTYREEFDDPWQLVTAVSILQEHRPDSLIRISHVEVEMQWVSAYDHNRSYGGPEEGGWWYDTGVLLDSIPCENEEQIEEAKERLKRIHGPAFEGNHGIGSVLCEGVLQIVVEEKRGQDYPQERPHYE